ncbi:MAG TPA: hypothetical protein VK832_11645, partial [Burkholderiaceae bacterium]|nr:hypothetical protein [Burkholderiaceae bacterium]
GDDHTFHAHELALPMSHRGNLHGFVLLAVKPSGEEYRPDEVEVLGFGAHQIGLDLYALQIERLKAKSDTDETKIREQQHIIEHLQTSFAQIGGGVSAHHA